MDVKVGLKNGFTKDLAVTRRGFVKGMTAMCAVSALYGCSSDTDTEYVMVPVDNGGTSDNTEPTYIYGSSTHNCGGRCISKAEVKNGRVVRILTDENNKTGFDTYINPTSRNTPQTRSCARCRGYRYRIYHPGRLKYPLKQTKTRGDLTGFVRISWDQALSEITTKHKKVYDKYGVDGIYVFYDSAANDGVQGRDALDYAYRYMPGNPYKWQFGSYSTHQYQYFGAGYTGMNEAIKANDMAKHTKTLVMWGENGMTTVNNITYSYSKIADDMKARDPQSKVIFVGPEFSDSGVVMADEWIVSKPYTDPAIIAGMIYHMLDNTFDLSTGVHKGSDAWLDVDYLDTMVYGFFDSPAYNLTDATGVIATATATAAAGTRNVPAVPAGRSYCSWILGNKTGPAYSATTTNYTAAQYKTIAPNTKRWSSCSYAATKGSATVYKTKQDYTTPKTPAWASAVSGVPEQTIKDLAQTYIKNKPVAATWSGGMQKQADGIANLFAVQALQIITGNAAELGTAFLWAYTSAASFPGLVKPTTFTINNGTISQNMPTMLERPKASCTAWHTILKATYADELKANGYQAKYIPNWSAANNKTIATGDGDIYWDDAGTKAALLTWKRAGTSVKTYSDGTNTYYDWVGRVSGADGTPGAHAGTPLIAGIRLAYNSAGNIFLNQHENSNDSRDMIEKLPKCKFDDADSFCFVTFDNFLSPTPRWSDYVLPMSTSWEHDNIINPQHASTFFMKQATNPPGESKQAFHLGIELLQKYEALDSSAAGAAVKYSGGNVNNSVETIAKAEYYKYQESVKLITATNTLSSTITSGPYYNPKSPYYMKPWEEYLKMPYLVSKADENASTPPTNYAVKQNYTAANKLNAFIKSVAGYNIATNDYTKGGYDQIAFADISTAPAPSLRYHVYSPVLVWQYENLYSKWHGYYKGISTAQKNLVGQMHKDFEGDRFVNEIPMYYAYQDYFMEAYGNSAAKIADLKFLLTTTHDRYRSHSSMAENPMLRELNHRVPGQDAKGNIKTGNDYGYYSMGPTKSFAVGGSGTYPYLAGAIEADGTVKPENKEIASYSEIWMNESDGLEMGLKDGDLIQVENPVGAVRVVARLTKRCAKGYVGLHQGCWYDPRPLPNSYGHEFVDVGGNCNTLMASQPSRIDHGNGQQTAFVKISKVNY